jgi:outer membrane protein insertion porin family
MAQGANSIQSALPAFSDPKFKDRLFASGGPIVQDAKNGKLVTKIIIQGNRSISESNILSHMQTREERIFDNDVFSRDVAELYNTGFFNSVRPTFTEDENAGTLEIKLVVAEKATIRKVTFHGNRVYSDKKLLKYCGFQVGDPISPHTVLAARNRLEEYYKSEGFNHANVEVYEGDKPNDREITYRISEGELERVDNIRFVGNVAFNTEILKTKISTHDSNRYIPNITTYMGNKAILDRIDDDRIALTEYYRSLGYFDARIDRVLEYDSTGKWVNLTFVIYEGEPYTVRHVSVEGNHYYSTDRIQPFLEVRDNSAYRQNKKINDERFLRDAYGAVGFIFCEVVARLDLEPENHIVDIVYEVEEGDIYRCSDINIHIEGDKSYTKERVAMNLLGNLRPNAIIDGTELNNAKRRLSNSTIFETNPANGVTPRISVKPFKFEEESEMEP